VVFDLNYAQAMMIQFAFFTAYFVCPCPRRRSSAGSIQERHHHRLGGGGLGCLAFYPAAAVRSYAIFLLALFILASGITLLQVAANPFVAILAAGNRIRSLDPDPGPQLAGHDLGAVLLALR